MNFAFVSGKKTHVRLRSNRDVRPMTAPSHNSIANCFRTGQSNDEAASCLARKKVRVGTVCRICAETKFQAETQR
jgi:hypothetical protein